MEFQLDFFFFLTSFIVTVAGKGSSVCFLPSIYRPSWPTSTSRACLSLDVLGTLDFGHHITPSTLVDPPILPANWFPLKVVLIDDTPCIWVASRSNQSAFHVVFHNCTLDGPPPCEHAGQVVRVMFFRWGTQGTNPVKQVAQVHVAGYRGAMAKIQVSRLAVLQAPVSKACVFYHLVPGTRSLGFDCCHGFLRKGLKTYSGHWVTVVRWTTCNPQPRQSFN